MKINIFSLPIRKFANGKHSIFIFHKTPLQANPLTPSEFNLSNFEYIINYISDNFKVVPLEDSISNFESKRWREPLASITFDDGYTDWFNGVVPILLEKKLPATFFITTGQFLGEHLWHERVINAITKCSLPKIQLTTLSRNTLIFNLETKKNKIIAIQKIEKLIKYKSLQERHDSLFELEIETNTQKPSSPTFKPEDARRLHSLGFGIGAHTVNHPILKKCNFDDAKIEIFTARETLAHLISGTVHGFAYPNGIAGKDFSFDHVEMVKQAGYSFAVTTDAGVANRHTSPYLLPRFTPWGKSQARVNFQIARNLFTVPAGMEKIINSQKNNALMIAFHFPPQAGSSGVQRTLNFVRHLPKHGWQPTVLTAVESAYETTRDDLLKTLPSAPIHRAFALDAARHLSIAGKYLRITAIPDRWISWSLFGAAKGHRLIRQQKPDIIWSTYPLATANLIAAKLSRTYQIPWVADFRDPMIISPTSPSAPLERWAKQRIEAMTMRHAHCCIFTTPHAAELHKQRYPFAAEKCVVIPNGFDNEAFEGITPNRHGIANDTLLMLHSGLIYPIERDPTTFFKGIKNLIDSESISREKIRVRFRGSGNDDLIREIIRKFEFEDIVELLPTIPFREAIAEMAGADILLVFQGSQFNPQIPAKIYEYLRAGSVVLGIVDHQGSAAAELRKFAGTVLADIQDSHEIASALTIARSQISAEQKLQFSQANFEQLLLYSRAAQTERLAELLTEVATGS